MLLLAREIHGAMVSPGRWQMGDVRFDAALTGSRSRASPLASVFVDVDSMVPHPRTDAPVGSNACTTWC